MWSRDVTALAHSDQSQCARCSVHGTALISGRASWCMQIHSLYTVGAIRHATFLTPNAAHRFDGPPTSRMAPPAAAVLPPAHAPVLSHPSFHRVPEYRPKLPDSAIVFRSPNPRRSVRHIGEQKPPIAIQTLSIASIITSCMLLF